MSLALRRLLNHLPLLPGSRREIYLKASWHKPSPFDQWRSQAPFRSRAPVCEIHFGRNRPRQRALRWFIRGLLAVTIVWIVMESIRALVA